MGKKQSLKKIQIKVFRNLLIRIYLSWMRPNVKTDKGYEIITNLKPN